MSENRSSDIRAIEIRWRDTVLRADAGTVVTIGRDPSSTVALDDSSVSRHHAEIRVEDGAWYFVDLSSTQGSHAEGRKIERLRIDSATTIVIGHRERGVTITIAPIGDAATEMASVMAPPAPIATSAATEMPSRPGGSLREEPVVGATVVTGSAITVSIGSQSRTLVPGQELVIGRDPGCEMTSANPTLSRRHLRVHHDGHRWMAVDLSSSGGTFLDGSRITDTELVGNLSLWLGDPDSGERVVVAAGGVRHLSAADRLERVARRRAPAVILGAAAVAIVALVVGVLAFTRDSGGGSVATDDLARATVRILVNDGSGSGTIIDADKGLILTNAHVVKPQASGQALGSGKAASDLDPDPDTIQIAVSGGRDQAAEVRYLATVVAADGYLDLAVVRITKTAGGAIISPADLRGLRQITIGNSDGVRSGDAIRAVGYPGVANSKAPTITEGTIASPTSDDRLSSNRAEFNTTASIAPGNSGGAAVDAKGRLIGVPSAGRFDKESVSKVGIIRPINFAKDLIAAASAGTAYTSPYVTPLGSEAISNIRPVAAVAASGFSLGCDSASATPASGARTLTVAMDFTGFPTAKHQDVIVGVLAGDSLIGAVEAGSQYPFVWKSSGCATVTLALSRPLGAGTDYKVVVLMGPNYERAAKASLSFNVGGAGPAPQLPAGSKP